MELSKKALRYSNNPDMQALWEGWEREYLNDVRKQIAFFEELTHKYWNVPEISASIQENLRQLREQENYHLNALSVGDYLS